ncbi:lysosomal enzyme trafficking factor isoform X3 [Rhineura floridana]|uniref:lysosomal enzyme trafficking factor isoform X3 n=1 Tax=Rhineura floridana TaxID=261503 RepID=UPI002AC839D6|nr:lysosomal enzyme trafficking factor isoform X3 [Rhineura floridana]
MPASARNTGRSRRAAGGRRKGWPGHGAGRTQRAAGDLGWEQAGNAIQAARTPSLLALVVPVFSGRESWLHFFRDLSDSSTSVEFTWKRYFRIGLWPHLGYGTLCPLRFECSPLLLSSILQ